MRTFKDMRLYKMSTEERVRINRLLASPAKERTTPSKPTEQLAIPADAYVKIGKGHTRNRKSK